MKHIRSYKLFESDLKDNFVLDPGTEMFHSTSEPFDEKNLRGGGYDGVVWTTDTSGISQTYIPQSGGTLYVSADHIAAPSKEKTIQAMQRAIGIEYDYDNIEWDGYRASSWMDAPVFAHLGNGFEDFTRKYVREKMLSELGYEPDDTFSGREDAFAVKVSGSEPKHNSYRLKGRLFVITNEKPLKIYDMTYGGMIDGDLTDPDYKKVSFFQKLADGGYDGVKINDWTQTEEFGNFGHTSIGLFPDGLKKCTWAVLPDVTYPDEFEKMADAREWDSQEYKEYKKIIHVKEAELKTDSSMLDGEEDEDVPPVVYHGSDQKFDRFDFKKGHNHTILYVEEVDRGAFFFAEDKEQAKAFGKYVYSAKLDIKKLDNWRDPGYMDERVFHLLSTKYRHRVPYNMSEYWQMIDDEQIREDIKKLGIDGIKSFEYDPDTDEQILTWIVFDPKQIKIIGVE